MRTIRPAIVIAAVVAAGATDAAPAELAPHRAFYELHLADGASELVEADGAFAIEWRAQCEGTASRQRLWFVGRLPGGGRLDVDVRFSTWESADDRRMRFSMRSYQSGELVEEFRGQATMPEGDGPGRATYTVPEGVRMTLPADTIFPKRHLERLIERAEAGEAVAHSRVFDGAGLGSDALTLVTAAIGDPLAPPPEAGAERAWPIALAYHPIGEGDDGAPLFELSFALAADGIMRDVLLDYGAFALSARLERLERLDPPDCR